MLPRQPQKNDAVMQQALPEHQLTKVLVGGQKSDFLLRAEDQHVMIGHTWMKFGDVNDLMPFAAEGENDATVYAFVGDQIHATRPTG